jgi:hypothetical protein
VTSGAAPWGQGVLHDLMVGLGRLRCGLVSAASGFDGNGGGKVFVRGQGGAYIGEGVVRAGSYDA